VRVEITLCVQNLHSCVCSSQNACENHTKEWFLHAGCGSDTYKCHNHFRECHSHSYVSTSHCACWNRTRACRNQTLCSEITLVRVLNITHKIDFYTQSVVLTRMKVIITLIRVKIAPCVFKSHSCMLKSYFTFPNYTRACDHNTMRVNITLCVWTSHYACEYHTMRVNNT
jgi:hypothetical protein